MFHPLQPLLVLIAGSISFAAISLLVVALSYVGQSEDDEGTTQEGDIPSVAIAESSSDRQNQPEETKERDTRRSTPSRPPSKPALSAAHLRNLGAALSSDARVETQVFMGIVKPGDWSSLENCKNSSIQLGRSSTESLQRIGKKIEGLFRRAMGKNGSLTNSNLVPVNISLDKLINGNAFEHAVDQLKVASNIGSLSNLVLFESDLRRVQWECWNDFRSNFEPPKESLPDNNPIKIEISTLTRSPSFKEHQLYHFTPLVDVDVLKLSNTTQKTLRDVFVGIQPNSLIDASLTPLPYIVYRSVWKPGESIYIEEELTITQFDGIAVSGIKEMIHKSRVAQACPGVHAQSFWNGANWSSESTVEFPD